MRAIEPAQRANRGIHCRCNQRFIRNVDAYGEGLAALRGYVFSHHLGCFLIDVCNADQRAFAGKATNRGRADPCSGADHYKALSLQTFTHSQSPLYARVLTRPRLGATQVKGDSPFGTRWVKAGRSGSCAGHFALEEMVQLISHDLHPSSRILREAPYPQIIA